MACDIPLSTVSKKTLRWNLRPDSGVSDTEIGLNIGGKVKIVNSGRMNVFGEPTLELNLKKVENETSLAASILKGFTNTNDNTNHEQFIPSIEAAVCFEVDPDDSSQ